MNYYIHLNLFVRNNFIWHSLQNSHQNNKDTVVNYSVKTQSQNKQWVSNKLSTVVFIDHELIINLNTRDVKKIY